MASTSASASSPALTHKLYPLLLALAHILVGVLLLVNPVAFSSAVIIIAGIWLVVMGALSLFRYFKDDPRQAILKQEMASGLLMLVAGVFFILNPGSLISLVPAMILVYGAVLLFGSFRYLQMAVDFWRLKLPLFPVALSGAAIQLIASIVFLTNPFGTSLAAFIFVGIFFLLTGLFSLALLVMEKITPSKKAVELKRADAPAPAAAPVSVPAEPAPAAEPSTAADVDIPTMAETASEVKKEEDTPPTLEL